LSWWQAFGSAWGWYIANRDAFIPIGGLLGGAAVAWAALRQAGIAVRRHYAQTEADRQRRITESFSKAVEQDRVLLCAHGGGYVVGSMYTHRKVYAHVSQRRQAVARSSSIIGARPRTSIPAR
jgi:hypothetical protein